MIKIFQFIFLLLISSVYAYGQFTDLQKASLKLENLYTNGGAEQAKKGWSETGGGTLAIESTTIRSGKAAIKFTSSATSDYLNFPSVTVKRGSNNCESIIYYKSTSANFDLEVYYSSTRVAKIDLPANTEYQKAIVSFVCSDVASSYTTKITNGANTEIIYVDDAYIGETTSLGLITQASAIGSAKIAETASCFWSRTTASLGAFTSDADCPGPTVINDGQNGVSISTTDTNLPKFTVNNLPAGRYLITVSLRGYCTPVGYNCAWAINDGSSSYGQLSTRSQTYDSLPVTLSAIIEYNSAGNRTFEIYGGPESGATVGVELQGTGAYASPVMFNIVKFPTASEQVVKAETSTVLWQGYHNNTCDWTRSVTGSQGDFAADASCTFTEITNKGLGTVTSALSGSDKLPGVTFTPPVAGYYEVCFFAGCRVDGTGQGSVFLTDGTTNVIGNNQYGTTASQIIPQSLCGFFEATSTSSKTVKFQAAAYGNTFTCSGSGTYGSPAWTIKLLSQQYPMPQIINSVTTDYNGITKIAAAHISQSGSETSICSSSPCGVFNQPGDGITSVTRSATGYYVINFKSGYFSAKPICTCSASSQGGSDFACLYNHVISSSSTGYIYTRDAAGVDVDGNPSVICVGKR